MFFSEVTPLIGGRDAMRAARMYPGGEHLDRIFGRKPRPEPAWHYPEAWLFSPSAAINPGSSRSDEGLTRLYDREGRAYLWEEYTEKLGEELLGPYGLRLIVKLLDGAVTLPKEFHFRAQDEERLRGYPRLRSFTGTLIKPEVWIRHPAAGDAAGPSYAGFKEKLAPEALLAAIAKGAEALEEIMNAVTIAPGSALYLPGGIVHSLGPGLYFEVLADGDLKVTLQEAFAGRELSLEERLDKVYTGREDDLLRCLELVDYDSFGEAVLERCLCRPTPLDTYQSRVVSTPHFEVDWIRVPPYEECSIENAEARRPRILIAATGRGTLLADRHAVELAADAGSYEEFTRSGSCYGAIVHYATPHFRLRNRRDEPLVVLHAREPVTEG